jgi:hypothetical protein
MTVVIFHELSHAFTKYIFHNNDTPIGVGPHGDSTGEWGESGWLVEETIMGGKLAVEWDDGCNFGNMDLISRVLLVDGPVARVISKAIAYCDGIALIPF